MDSLVLGVGCLCCNPNCGTDCLYENGSLTISSNSTIVDGDCEGDPPTSNQRTTTASFSATFSPIIWRAVKTCCPWNYPPVIPGTNITEIELTFAFDPDDIPLAGTITRTLQWCGDDPLAPVTDYIRIHSGSANQAGMFLDISIASDPAGPWTSTTMVLLEVDPLVPLGSAAKDYAAEGITYFFVGYTIDVFATIPAFDQYTNPVTDSCVGISESCDEEGYGGGGGGGVPVYCFDGLENPVECGDSLAFWCYDENWTQVDCL